MCIGFSYDDNPNMKKIEKFGIEWDYRSSYDRTDTILYFRFINSEFGEFVISEKALKRIEDTDQYKVLSLLFEQNLKKSGIYAITLAEEKEKLQWKYDDHISLSLEEFLGRFPSNFIEIQQRALLIFYYKYTEYGQEIKHINKHAFFAKNNSELFFILKSLKEKGFIEALILEGADGNSFVEPYQITVDGWLEIEKIIKDYRKKQVFIAMKFKDMDKVRNSIRQAIIDANFSPLRIDEKEHINEISSEIQYEISQSGPVVADVTGQNQGVYFEAGYAMGLNIPVIWTCNEKEKNDIHFDIRQYNTILWEDENDLYERLKKRITAVMGLRRNGLHHEQ